MPQQVDPVFVHLEFEHGRLRVTDAPPIFRRLDGLTVSQPFEIALIPGSVPSVEAAEEIIRITPPRRADDTPNDL